MKRLITLAAVFAVAFAISAGLTVTKQAEACIPCGTGDCWCMFEEGICSSYTGPNCTDPEYPYYHYTHTCFRKPDRTCCLGSCQTQYGVFDGCCADPD